MTQLHYIATRGGNQFPRCLGLQSSFSPWSGVLLGKAFKRANSFSVPSVPGSRCQTSYPCFPEVLGDCNFGWQLRNRQNTELRSRTKPSMAAQCRAEPLHHRLHLYKGVNKSLSERTSGLVRSARHVQFIITKNNISWNIWVPFMGLLICKSAFSLWGPNALPWEKWVSSSSTWGRNELRSSARPTVSLLINLCSLPDSSNAGPSPSGIIHGNLHHLWFRFLYLSTAKLRKKDSFATIDLEIHHGNGWHSGKIRIKSDLNLVQNHLMQITDGECLHLSFVFFFFKMKKWSH